MEGLELADDILRRLESIPSIITDEERKAVIKKAELDAIYAFYKSLFSRQFCQDFIVDGITPGQHLETDSQKVIIDRARNAVITKPPYALITINPRLTITYEELEKAVNKFKKRKFIDNYLYVYEVRKEDFSGLHCHMLIKYNCKPYDLKRNAKSTFKHVCDSDNPSILNIKFIAEDILPSKIEYLKGNKKDSKKPGVIFTKEFRFSNGIPDIFESTPQFPCRGAEYLEASDLLTDETGEPEQIN